MTATQVDAQLQRQASSHKAQKGSHTRQATPTPTCRVGGRKMKDTTAVGSKVPAVGQSCQLLVPKGSEAVTVNCLPQRGQRQ